MPGDLAIRPGDKPQWCVAYIKPAEPVPSLLQPAPTSKK
jgi:hypothetical protein